MAEDDRSTVSGRSTPNAVDGPRKVGARRAPRPMDADSESTVVMSAVPADAPAPETAQTYSTGRRAKTPTPVAGRRRAAVEAPAPVKADVFTGTIENEDTIVFPAVGALPEGRMPGARRARARAARASRARGRATALAGAATVAIAAIGSLTIASPASILAGQDAALAKSYVGANATNATDVSRNFDRELAVQKPIQAKQLQKAIADYNASVDKKREARGEEIVKNQWVLPVVGYRLTARFGQGGGLWSSGRHTGLDFAGPSGTQIVAVAGGTVTSAGYEGSYGNRTIITLADGTEIWYCHQSAIHVSVGEEVAPGDPIGLTGATGNVTGPHLHLEVHPGGGAAVDPYTSLVAHGVTP